MELRHFPGEGWISAPLAAPIPVPTVKRQNYRNRAIFDCELWTALSRSPPISFSLRLSDETIDTAVLDAAWTPDQFSGVVVARRRHNQWELVRAENSYALYLEEARREQSIRRLYNR